MANEITTSIFAQVLKSTIYISETVSTGNLQMDMAGSHVHHATYALDTSVAAIGKGAITNVGLCIVRNCTAAGTVQVSFDGGSTSHLSIPAGKAVLLHLTPGITITNVQLKMSATTGVARVLIVEA
jgi:hypothetical protein